MTNPISKVAIVGAGPAGSSLAVRLAMGGINVTLIERETFPRHKLCGEFISPECLRHFDELGVLDQMLAAGGQRIFETRFSDRKGNGFSVPSSQLDAGGFALSLSRSSMDKILLDRARELGVTVFEGAKVSDVILQDNLVTGMYVNAGRTQAVHVLADLFVDATGRNLALSRLAHRKASNGTRTLPQRSLAIGFKNHFSNVQIEPGTCEIFFFPGGYGGLTTIEDGMANLCFLIDPTAARRIGTDPVAILDQAVLRSARAAEAMQHSKPVREWLAVSISSFGRANIPKFSNLVSVGDSAAFIDPFTGSGMLIALESAFLAASAISDHQQPVEAGRAYAAAHERAFKRRLLVCSMLRRAAFWPFVPAAALCFLNMSSTSRNYLASSTRSAKPMQLKNGENG